LMLLNFQAESISTGWMQVSSAVLRKWRL